MGAVARTEGVAQRSVEKMKFADSLRAAGLGLTSAGGSALPGALIREVRMKWTCSDIGLV